MTRQVRWCGLQNVKKQCEFKHLKEDTVNWLPYLMFQVCFMISKICSSSAKTIVVSELKWTLRNSSHLSASSRRRCLQNEDGVENTLETYLSLVHGIPAIPAIWLAVGADAIICLAKNKVVHISESKNSRRIQHTIAKLTVFTLWLFQSWLE